MEERFVVESEGDARMIRHENDFDAVDAGTTLKERTAAATWPYVRTALARAVGTGTQQIVLCCGQDVTKGIWQLSLEPDYDGLVSVHACRFAEMDKEVVEKMLSQASDAAFTITLIDPDGGAQTEEYSAETRDAAVAWIYRYLCAPAGFVPAVYPPGVAMSS